MAPIPVPRSGRKCSATSGTNVGALRGVAAIAVGASRGLLLVASADGVLVELSAASADPAAWSERETARDPTYSYTALAVEPKSGRAAALETAVDAEAVSVLSLWLPAASSEAARVPRLLSLQQEQRPERVYIQFPQMHATAVAWLGPRRLAVALVPVGERGGRVHVLDAESAFASTPAAAPVNVLETPKPIAAMRGSVDGTLVVATGRTLRVLNIARLGERATTIDTVARVTALDVNWPERRAVAGDSRGNVGIYSLSGSGTDALEAGTRHGSAIVAVAQDLLHGHVVVASAETAGIYNTVGGVGGVLRLVCALSTQGLGAVRALAVLPAGSAQPAMILAGGDEGPLRAYNLEDCAQRLCGDCIARVLPGNARIATDGGELPELPECTRCAALYRPSGAQLGDDAPLYGLPDDPLAPGLRDPRQVSAWRRTAEVAGGRVVHARYALVWVPRPATGWTYGTREDRELSEAERRKRRTVLVNDDEDDVDPAVRLSAATPYVAAYRRETATRADLGDLDATWASPRVAPVYTTDKGVETSTADELHAQKRRDGVAHYQVLVGDISFEWYDDAVAANREPPSDAGAPLGPAAAAAAAFTLLVVSADGDAVPVPVLVSLPAMRGDTIVRRVKELVAARAGMNVAPARMTLRYRGQELGDARTLASYGIAQDETLRLSVAPPAAPVQPAPVPLGAQSFTITVHHSFFGNGRNWTVRNVDGTWSVLRIKQAVARQGIAGPGGGGAQPGDGAPGWPPALPAAPPAGRAETFELSYHGAVLDDARTLASYGIAGDMTLQLRMIPEARPFTLSVEIDDGGGGGGNRTQALGATREDMTVAAIKERVKLYLPGYPDAARMQLRYQGAVLADDARTLGSYGIREAATVQLMLAAPAAPPAPAPVPAPAPAPAPATFTIAVGLGVTQTTFVRNVDGGWSVLRLKLAVAESVGSVERQQLRYLGTLLDDARTLASYGIRADAYLELTLAAPAAPVILPTDPAPFRLFVGSRAHGGPNVAAYEIDARGSDLVATVKARIAAARPLYGPPPPRPLAAQLRLFLNLVDAVPMDDARSLESYGVSAVGSKRISFSVGDAQPDGAAALAALFPARVPADALAPIHETALPRIVASYGALATLDDGVVANKRIYALNGAKTALTGASVDFGGRERDGVVAARVKTLAVRLGVQDMMAVVDGHGFLYVCEERPAGWHVERVGKDARGGLAWMPAGRLVAGFARGITFFERAADSTWRWADAVSDGIGEGAHIAVVSDTLIVVSSGTSDCKVLLRDAVGAPWPAQQPGSRPLGARVAPGPWRVLARGASGNAESPYLPKGVHVTALCAGADGFVAGFVFAHSPATRLVHSLT